MNDDELRRAFTGSPPDNSAEAPVDPQRVWLAVNGELSPEELAPLVDRAGRDQALAGEWRLAVAFSRELDLAATLTAPAKPPSLMRRWGWAALATAAGLALAWSLANGPPPELSESSAVRAPPPDAIESTIQGRTIHTNGGFLRWTPVQGADYRVFVSDENLDVLIDGRRTSEPRLQLQSDLLTPLSGRQIWWRVEAIRPGEPTIRSRTFKLDVVEP